MATDLVHEHVRQNIVSGDRLPISHAANTNYSDLEAVM
jgi:hypothetical protein